MDPAPDAGTGDAGTNDAGTSDAGTSDAGTSDAGTSDAGTSDAGEQHGALCATPAPLSFGIVSSHEERTLVLKSCDGRPVRLSGLSLAAEDQGFALVEPPTLPTTLAQADQLAVRVAFTPTTPRDARTDLLVLHDGELSRIRIEATAVRVCSTAETPALSLAVTDLNTEAHVPTGSERDTRAAVLLAAVATGPAATVEWSLPTAPPTARLELGNPETARILYPELAGEYVVEAVARTGEGCASPPARFSLVATHPERIVVELTWGEGVSDVDLHYVGPGGTPFDGGRPGEHDGTDVYADARWQDWGAGGVTDHDQKSDNDPAIAPVFSSGPGPEVLRHPAPEAGRYTVYVHHFCARAWEQAPSTGPVTAQVRVWADRRLVGSAANTLTQRDLWAVGSLDVTTGGIGWTGAVELLPKTTAAEQGCSAHTE